MKFTFSIVYNDELHHFIDADDCKKLKVQECAKQMTVTETTFEGAIALIQNTLASDNKTLKSLVLKLIEV